MVKEIKDTIKEFIDLVDLKLQTMTGRISLIIFACVIFGGSIVHAWNIQTAYNIIEKEKDKANKDNKDLQNTINLMTKNATAECNEQIKQGAMLQQQLQYIYNNKIQENEDYVKEQKKIIEEKKKILDIQNKNIINLNNLKN